MTAGGAGQQSILTGNIQSMDDSCMVKMKQITEVWTWPAMTIPVMSHGSNYVRPVKRECSVPVISLR